MAKGVLHRHFATVDDLLVALVEERITAIERRTATLHDAAGTGTVVGIVSRVLVETIDPVVIGIVGLAISRDSLRSRLPRRGLPVLPEVAGMLSAYLAAERGLGRISAGADPDVLARTLVGTGHLLLAGELGALPDAGAVAEVVESALVGALPGP
ncbi:TetR/AcrR family transcriptional regulator [Pseudonocardia ailaonensis]|uniref:TetR/AcrR family transcriptional regulator n=2 Tax=Pseudonocardia ailaonensis TaxID=367279 RepID=A0ABN2NMB6_9PSEU